MPAWERNLARLRTAARVVDSRWGAPARAGGRTAARTALRRWRGSLRLRVVTITMLCSAMVAAGFGLVVYQSITTGLVEAKRTSALNQMEAGRTRAQQQLSALSAPNDPDLKENLLNLISVLSNATGRPGSYEVVLDSSDQEIAIDPVSRNDAAPRYIPGELRRLVAGSKVNGYQFTRADPDGLGMRPYLAVGTPVELDWGSFELYYLFPLDEEVAAAALVRNTVLITGVALVMLLALIGWLVTNLVVSPVRMAARTAQRLSAGLLHERMTVRGQDELATLAASFNQMAGNLQQQIVQLEELSRLQRRFTSDVSHELRTPLTTVRMAADMLHTAREEFEPHVARSTELLQDELDRFENLLTDLLEISRFDAGFAHLESEAVDVVSVARRAVESLRSVARRQSVRVLLRAPADPVIAEVDPRRVERILRNLVGNAIEYSEGQPVTVTVAADASAVAIAVRDRGIGLRPGEEKLVFNRFWRADPSRARQTGGTGLGLSISMEDTRLHGGWLEASGSPGRGSQFRLTLPVPAGGRLDSSPLRLSPDPDDAAAGPGTCEEEITPSGDWQPVGGWDAAVARDG
ncbi:MAG: HAMP domain-containing protein [Micromonosporaceae bacterium]|nr:HAMP domain-containing protein [Micromonosporaceae bacterium]